MLSYGLFDGVARRDHLVAAAVLGPDDYREIYGKGMEDYLDYLLELEDTLLDVDGTVKVVRVPFHREMYREWLEHSTWQDGPEARSAWALEVAQNVESYERLRAERPVLPRAPEEEREVVEVLYLPCPLLCYNEEDLQRLSRQLDGQALARLWDKIMAWIPPLPPYRKLSRLRARGLTLAFGDRLIEPADVYELEHHFTSLLLGGSESGIAKVPRRFRIKVPELEIEVYPLLIAVLLPLVLRGAEEDVEFLAEWLTEKFVPGTTVSEEVRAVLRSAGWEGEKAGPPGPLLTARGVPGYLEALFEKYEPEEEEGGPDDGRGSRKRTIRRVK